MKFVDGFGLRAAAAVGATACLALGGLAQAQTATTAPAPTAAPVAGGAQLGIAVTEVDVVAKGWSVKRAFLGHKVHNSEGKTLGKIEDLIIAPDRQASYAIMEVGGFLGMGEHRIAVPVGQFKWGPKGEITLPGATKDALKAVPKFVYAKH